MGSGRLRSLVLLAFVAAPTSAMAFSSHPEVSASRSLSVSVVRPGGSVTVTMNLAIGSISGSLRGFYLTDQVPEGCAVSGQTATRNGAAAAFASEAGTLHQTFAGATPLRWVLETPPAFSEDRPLNAGDSLTFTYEVIVPGSAAHGTVYAFKNYSWVGRLAGGTISDAYGYEDLPEQTIAVDALPLASPSLVALAPDPTLDATPTLQWGAVGGASSYRIQISRTVDFTVLLVDTAGLTGTSFTPAAWLPVGAVFWRVSAVDAAGNESPFSSADSFSVQAISRLDIDRMIRDVKEGAGSEADVLEYIQRYSAGN